MEFLGLHNFLFLKQEDGWPHMVLLISLGQVIGVTDLCLDIDCETWDKSFKKCEISNALDGTEHVVFGKKVTSHNNNSNEKCYRSNKDFRGFYNQ